MVWNGGNRRPLTHHMDRELIGDNKQPVLFGDYSKRIMIVAGRSARTVNTLCSVIELMSRPVAFRTMFSVEIDEIIIHCRKAE